MVVIIACLGLRVSELLGLQWGSIDFENLIVTIQAVSSGKPDASSKVVDTLWRT